MSARPSPLERPSDEELDLLISRSLDGDLSPEEEQELGKLLLADPVVRARRDRMAALVAELGRVPAPVPPFALATRVSSRVLEKAGGVGLPSGLAGRAPKMGLVFATLAALGIVALYRILTGGSVLAPVPSEKVAAREAAKAAPADSSREPVEVFFQESAGAKAEAAKPGGPAGAAVAAGAGAPAAAASQDAPVLVAEARPAAPAAAPEAGSRSRANEAASKEKSSALPREQAEPAAAGEADRFAPEPLAKTDAVASRDDRARDEREAVRVAEAVPAAPAAPSVARQAADLDLGLSARGAGEAQSAPAPALAAKGARAPEAKAREESASPRVVLHDAAQAPAGPGEGVTLSAPSGGKAAWRLSSPPDLSSLPSPLGATYRVTLDGTGRVVSLRRISVAPESAAPGVERFLRGLAFLPVPGVPAAAELDVRVSRD